MDAECTHDGSIKHIQKFEQWGWKTLSRRVLDADRTDDLTVLQVYVRFYLPHYFLIGHNFTSGHFWCLFLVFGTVLVTETADINISYLFAYDLED